MSYPVLVIETVWHVGSFDIADKVRTESQEGDLLSVSEHPDEWEAIARLGGGERWEMTLEGAEWLDAMALTPEQDAAISDWAEREGYARRVPVWRSWSRVGEDGEWGYGEHESPGEAERHVDEDDLENGPPPSEGGALIEERAGLILTDPGRAACGRMPAAIEALSAVTILWADKVARAENGNLVGVWWDDDYAPERLICPRGGVFPDRIKDFEIEDDYGNAPPHMREGLDGPAP